MTLQLHSFTHSVCLTTGLQPLPKRVLYTMRSGASSFNFQYPLASSSSSCLCLLPRLSVTSIFPSMCFIRQFLRNMWPVELPFLLFITLMYSSSPWLYVTLRISSFLTRSVQLIFSILLQHHISKLCKFFWSTFRKVQVSTQWNAVLHV